MSSTLCAPVESGREGVEDRGETWRANDSSIDFACRQLAGYLNGHFTHGATDNDYYVLNFAQNNDTLLVQITEL